MEGELGGILELALRRGVWAALYIYLFFRMLKESAAREERYQDTIDSLSGDIQEGIERIQETLGTLSGGEKDR